MKKIEIVFQRMKGDIAKSSFIASTICFIIMYIIVYVFGNPIIEGSGMYWHHIPEVFGLYFFGIWSRKTIRHVSFFPMLLLNYVFVPFSFMLIVQCFEWNLFVFICMLTSAHALGYTLEMVSEYNLHLLFCIFTGFMIELINQLTDRIGWILTCMIFLIPAWFMKESILIVEAKTQYYHQRLYRARAWQKRVGKLFNGKKT